MAESWWTSLFSNLGSGSSSFINLNDYASIKNGSYGKLMKAYYKSTEDDTKTGSTSSKKKTESVDTTGLAQMKKDAEGLKSATEALAKDDLWTKTSGTYDTDKITSAVSEFVKEYNAVVKQSDNVSSSDIATNVRYMTSLTNTMSKALEKVGITVGDDAKLTLNEDTLKSADMKTVKALFYGSTSFASQTADKASEIAKAAVNSSSIYSKDGSISSTLSGLFDGWV